jgi:lipopolysaccharide/colanic/teichoic acid biosynthesis glycosyltransferase
MIKFRTMINNSFEYGQTMKLTEDPFGLIEGDPRVSRLGGFLRRTGLDELPQLLNVLRGDMSLIGPRPDIPEQVINYSQLDKERLLVRPGITGLAQVVGRDQISWPAKIELDREYIRRMSWKLEIWIGMRTLCEPFRHRGGPLFDEWNVAKARRASAASAEEASA